ncbi:glycosyltransferase family 4 protein [[Phormidium] sp. ETS-05]|uniref:glycosyltransferase family 4 protein n=1 Tax=[Phormidium] sp. ETS-05 TaxID=222819 RepID=UPI0031FE9898
MMKVLLVNTTDIEGGAARAAFRLHQGLLGMQVDSKLLVQRKLSDDPRVIEPVKKLEQEVAKLRQTLDRLPMQVYPGRTKEAYSLGWLPDRVATKVQQLNPDVVNLHWVGEGFVNIATLQKLHQPIVWTFHDMWGFTGGCHYALECDRYETSCGACPQLQSSKPGDLSHWVWQRKRKAWENLNLTIVTPSKWLAKCTRESALFAKTRVEVIPNGIDVQKYRPLDRHTARSLLELPQDKQLVLFGAMRATTHKRKGFEPLQAALLQLSKSGWQDKIELVVFGASHGRLSEELGFKCHYLGKLGDELSLVLAYSAADVFVLPSLQDNLPNTIMESLACGTPCVAFDIGGMPDMIEHEQNGYLAAAYNIDDLAQGIAWVLENGSRHQKLSQRAREKVETEFTLEIQARRYLSVYGEMVSSGNSSLGK